IRDFHVTGVQTCALPIWAAAAVASTTPPATAATPPAFCTASAQAGAGSAPATGATACGVGPADGVPGRAAPLVSGGAAGRSPSAAVADVPFTSGREIGSA